MADLVSGGAMGSVVLKLDELLKEEYKLQAGVKERIRSLTFELKSAQAALLKVAEVPWDQLDEQVKLWVREVRKSSYDMEDVLDIFLMDVQGRDSAEQQSSRKRLGEKMANLFKKSKARREIWQIMNQLDQVMERCRRYKVDDIVAKPAPASMVDPRLAAMYNNVKNLVGIDESRGELISMLLRDDVPNTKMKIKIVSVVGVGGLGKTTLARAVYDKIKGDFDCTTFVSIGRNPDLKKVFMDILIDLDRERYKRFNTSVLDEKQLIDELRSFFFGKRLLIVIDDIWELQSWRTIKLAIDDENNYGCRIIIATTRSFEVARDADQVYKMQALSYESSRKLFYTRIFRAEGKHVDNRTDEISDKILKKCGGLPLAIITVASLLADTPQDKWSDIYESIGSGHEDNMEAKNTLMRTLQFSYYDMPSHLRACLLYLSVFPEDYVIRKHDLVWKWVAEGFVRDQQGKRLFEIGEEYFHDLINRSFIQAVESKFGDDIIYGCRVHDLIHDFIRSISHEEKFMTLLEKESDILTLDEFHCRRLAILNTEEGQSLGDHIMRVERLRSLFAIQCPMSTMILPQIYRFRLLRVLALESCGSMEGYDLKHLRKLLHLRLISLRNTSIRKLPEEMRRLKFLQTLELEGSGVEELPASISELTGLMCLNTDWTTRLLSDGVKNLSSLQQLVIYPGGGNDEYSARWFVEGLGNLKELRVLRFLMKAQDEGQLRDLLQSLSKLPKIEVIHFDYYGVELKSGLEMSADFTLSRSLRSLELCWLEFSRLPAWINAQKLPNLCRLSLMLFDVEEDDLEILGQFPELRHLHMLIVSNERGEIISPGSGAFQKLESCSVTTLLKFRPGAMPGLQVLDFRFNFNVRRLLSDYNFGIGLEHLLSLRQIFVEINPPEEIDRAEEVLTRAVNCHPNTPILHILNPKSKTDDDGMQNIHYSADQEKEEHIGIDEPSDKLIKKLTDDAYGEKLRILSIVRSEGRGKNTLAQKVFDKLRPRFDCGAFVQVGKNPDLRKVFTDILVSVDKQRYNDFPLTVLDLMELIGLVLKSLVYKRFFVIVDDIWDIKAWEIIKCALIDNTNRSAVLTTSHDICITTDVGGVEQFVPLSITESKKLFYKKLFGLEDSCPSELENMCGELVNKCDGTLSAIDETVTSLASIQQTVKDWQPVYDRRIFDLSFPKLPDHLKKCLLYFSMFRKGYEISGECLVWAWIAEDFVELTQGSSEQTLQDVGESYLSKLVREKMIEAVEVDAGGKALSCRVYDFVHDFILSVSTEENFATILNNSQGRALPDAEVLERAKQRLSQEKSLIVSCDYLQASHLKGMSKITSLRYLAIGGKCMASIPTEITKLRNLQTLDLSASSLNQLPKSVVSLKKLERLCVNSQTKIPYRISKMLNLQELGDVNIIEPDFLKKLRALKKLRVLRISIWSWDESLKNFAKQLSDNLGSLVRSRENIKSLSIQTCCSLDFVDGLDVNAFQSLKNLEIRRSPFDRLPSWFGSLSNISSLTIEVYELSQDIIHTLGKLPTLGSLSLTSKEVPKVYFFIDSERFKNLASLKFVSNAMVEIFPREQSNATHHLKRLTIVFQASRTNGVNEGFRFGLENLSSLEHVRVEIICFNASHRMVGNAEAAIRKAVFGVLSSNLEPEIRRHEEERMIGDEVDFR